jgi:DNA polymerase-3 subunit epsilon
MTSNNAIPSSRNSAIIRAKRALEMRSELLFLDTETTGLAADDEIVEIAIVSYDGQVAYHSLVKSYKSIPLDASRIHGIHDDEVKDSPRIIHIWPQVAPMLDSKTVAIYNDDFDLRMLKLSLRQPGWRPNFKTIDIMSIFSEFIGEYDLRHYSYRFFKLEEARKYFNIPIQNSHRATEDTMLARAVLFQIAGLDY